MIVMIFFAVMEVLVWIACLHVLGSQGIAVAVLFTVLAGLIIASEIENIHRNKRDDFRGQE